MTLQYAAQIVHVDEEEVLYLAGEEMQDLGGTLMRLDLADLSEAALADNVLLACAVTGDAVYYVSALDPTALMRLEIDASGDAQATATRVAEATGNIASLHALPEGLVAALGEGQGALLYNHRAGAFAEYTGDVPAAAAYTDDAYLRLSAEGLLTAQALDNRRGRVRRLWCAGLCRSGRQALLHHLHRRPESPEGVRPRGHVLAHARLAERGRDPARRQRRGPLPARRQHGRGLPRRPGNGRTDRLQRLRPCRARRGRLRARRPAAGSHERPCEPLRRVRARRPGGRRRDGRCAHLQLRRGSLRRASGGARARRHPPGRLLGGRGRGDQRRRAQTAGGIRHALARQPRRGRARPAAAPHRPGLPQRRRRRHFRPQHAVRRAPLPERSGGQGLQRQRRGLAGDAGCALQRRRARLRSLQGAFSRQHRPARHHFAGSPARARLPGRRRGRHLRRAHRGSRGHLPGGERPFRQRLRHPRDAAEALRLERPLLHQLHLHGKGRHRRPRARAQRTAQSAVLPGGDARQQLQQRHRRRRQAPAGRTGPAADGHGHRVPARAALLRRRAGIQRLYHPAARRFQQPRGQPAAPPARPQLLRRQHHRQLRLRHQGGRGAVPVHGGPERQRRGHGGDAAAALLRPRARLRRAHAHACAHRHPDARARRGRRAADRHLARGFHFRRRLLPRPPRPGG